MEEIKIWAIDGSQVEDLKPVSGVQSEKLLEDTLVNSPDLLLDDLILVGRQTQTEGGPLDLLGVDGNGRLVVFELKRGTLNRDAVAQVIDYASDLDRMDLDTLAKHISERSGAHGIDKIEDFQDWYTNDQRFEDLESLKPLRMFLVGLGVDAATERMVKFLAENSGMDISLLTFHGFRHDSKTLLAKRVEVDGAEVPSPKQSKPSPSREERLEKILGIAESHGVKETFSKIRASFLDNWSEVSETVRTYSFYYLVQRVWYAQIIPENGRVRIFFYPWTLQYAQDDFESAKASIPWETRHYNHRDYRGDGIDFLIESDKWESYEEELTQLLQAVDRAWWDE